MMTPDQYRAERNAIRCDTVANQIINSDENPDVKLEELRILFNDVRVEADIAKTELALLCEASVARLFLEISSEVAPTCGMCCDELEPGQATYGRSCEQCGEFMSICGECMMTGPYLCENCQH